MWILNWLPNWIFYGIFLAGCGVFFLGRFLPMIKLYAPVLGLALMLLGTWYSGGIAKDKEWKGKVAELQVKVVAAEAKSAEVTTQIVTKIVTKNQIIKQRGADVIKYVDREIIKIDACAVPQEAIIAHNQAAKLNHD